MLVRAGQRWHTPAPPTSVEVANVVVSTPCTATISVRVHTQYTVCTLKQQSGNVDDVVVPGTTHEPTFGRDYEQQEYARGGGFPGNQQCRRPEKTCRHKRSAGGSVSENASLLDEFGLNKFTVTKM